MGRAKTPLIYTCEECEARNTLLDLANALGGGQKVYHEAGCAGQKERRVLMDIDKLIEAVRLCGSSPTIYQCEACAYYTGGDMGACIPEMTAQVAEALSMLQVLQDENDRLHEQIEDARLEGYAKGLGELERVKRERNVAYKLLGGEPPKTCKTCVLWGGNGWAQYQIGYCEGDDNPHGPNDFCSRHRGPQKEG